MGVGERTVPALWEAGVTHWDDFAGGRVGETRAERIDASIQRRREAVACSDIGYLEAAFPGRERWRLWAVAACPSSCAAAPATRDRVHVAEDAAARLHRG